MITAPAVVDPRCDERWSDLADRRGSLFHSRPWMEALGDTYGFTPEALVMGDSGMAYCELDDVVGHRIVSLPFSDCCDPLIATVEEWAALVDPLVARGVPVLLRCRTDRIAEADPRFRVVKRARWHVLDVDRSTDALWHAMNPSARRATRRARAAGVEIRRLEGDVGIAAFHELHVALRKTKYRMLAQPRSFFAALMDRFGAGDNWFALGAYAGDALLAATLYLRCGDVLYYKFNSSSETGLTLRPNNVLLWEGALLAQSHGCRSLDLGPSDDDQPGLIRFKRNHGAVESEVRFLRHDPPGFDDCRGTEVKAALGRLTRTLTDPGVPDATTASWGDVLYRYFA